MAEGIKIVATNRKARHEYHIEDTLEAGLVLRGTEVKSLRDGRLNLTDSFCTIAKGEMVVQGLHISPYSHGNQFNHEPMRSRKLLLHRKEIERWRKATEQKGYTIVPLKVYFKNGFAKMEIGLARGKKQYDKRADIAERETQRKLDRVMRGDRSE